VTDVAARIRAHLDSLSPNDLLIAHGVLDHPAEAPFETAESLAARVGVSKAAVVRFAVRLGYEGFSQLHDALRAEAVARLSPRSTSPARTRSRRGGRCARADLCRHAGGRPGMQFAAPPCRCSSKGGGKIGIFGHRKSAALAEYAYYLLNPLLPNTWPIAAGRASPTI
jgi:DNA-binding MurR/RpiR family transcriptional regulator